MCVVLAPVKVRLKEPPGYCGWVEQEMVKLEPSITCSESPFMEENIVMFGFSRSVKRQEVIGPGQLGLQHGVIYTLVLVFNIVVDFKLRKSLTTS